MYVELRAKERDKRGGQAEEWVYLESGREIVEST